jgi:environmental stress-induced protein Ves
MIISKNAYKRSTWKNGLGYTDEIAIYPPTASLVKGDFLWRLSSARIEKASPFSMFPAHERVLVVLDGEGIRMAHTFEPGEPEDINDVPPEQPYEFPGDIQSRCELIDGAITDFSVFTRTGELGADVRVEVATEGEDFLWHAEGKWNFVFAMNSNIETPEGLLSIGDTLSIGAGEITLRAVEGDSKILLVSLG